MSCQADVVLFGGHKGGYMDKVVLDSLCLVLGIISGIAYGICIPRMSPKTGLDDKFGVIGAISVILIIIVLGRAAILILAAP